MNLDFVKILEIRSIEHTLAAAVRRFEECYESAGRLPIVSITAGSMSYFGVPVKIQAIGSESMLALYAHDAGYNRQAAISFIKMRSIDSVTIANLEDHVTLVTGGRDVEESLAPTKLNLERSLDGAKATIEKLSGRSITASIDWSSEEARARICFADLIAALPQTFDAIAKDDLGKDAIKGIHGITLGYVADEGVRATRSGERIEITLGQPTKANFLVAELKKVVEEVL